MARSVFDAPQFQSEAAAFAYVEAHLWPTGAVCPHCGSTGADVKRLAGKTTRLGLHKCYACHGQFTVRQGSIFESSHLPLHLWLQVIHLMCASKKGISTRQIQRMLQCSMKTAWFLGHRIRAAMDNDQLGPFGSDGGFVEVDETFIGRDPENRPAKDTQFGIHHMNKVVSLIDRDTGAAKSVVIDQVTAKEVWPVLAQNISPDAVLMTDSSTVYRNLGENFRRHYAVDHSAGEYVRKSDPAIHTNTVEGSFSIFKRGMRGIYQHCSKKHLHRYTAEFDFRYSNRIAMGV
ncbi:MAG: IS1595 family transposase, partial [Caulobacteraceae bacterium]